MSIRSYAPTTGNGGDVESLLGDVFITNQKSPAWQLLNENADQKRPLGLITEQDSLEGFEQEFDEIGEIDLNGKNEGMLLSSDITCQC